MTTNEEIIEKVFVVLEYDKATEYWDKEKISEAMQKALAMKDGENIKIPKNAILVDKDDLEFKEFRIKKQRTDEILEIIKKWFNSLTKIPIEKELLDLGVTREGIINNFDYEELRQKIMALSEVGGK